MTAATQPQPTIPPGYKQTEVGIIPEDWEATRIDAHAVIKTGGKNTQDRIEDGAYPFFVRSQDVERIDSYSYDGEAVLTAGDGVGTGKVFHYVNGRFDVHQRVYRISDFSEQLSGRYFFFQFSTRFYDRIMSMTAKSSVDSVRMEMIAGMQLPLPPTRTEQEAIAGALSDADAWIESLEKLIGKKRAIKQGTMQALLTPPGQPGHQRLPGFKGEWEVKRLGEIAAIKDGTHQTPKYVNAGIPFYSVEQVTSGDFKNTKFISEEAHRILQRSSKIEKGDILMTRIGSIGDCKLVSWDVEASFYVSLALLKIHSCYSAEFIAHYSKSSTFKKSVELHSLQSAIPMKINLGPISDVQVVIPNTTAEQSAIAAVLTDMDAEIEAAEAKLAKARQIKQGMMQELLTGRVRLVGGMGRMG